MTKELMASLVLGGMLLVSQAIQHQEEVFATGGKAVAAIRSFVSAVEPETRPELPVSRKRQRCGETSHRFFEPGRCR
jgi:hypothetical protein